MNDTYTKIYAGGIAGRALASMLLASCLLLALSAPAAGAAGDAERLVDKARSAAAQDRHDEAVELYLAACDLDTALSNELGKEIGYQYLWSDRAVKALPWFERYLELHPDDLEAQLGYARALSWVGRHGESVDWYRKIVEDHPSSMEARIGEARVISWMERSGEAEELYLAVLESKPENLEARLGLAQVVNWQGRHREARKLYRGILKDHSGKREALTGLAQAERWLGMDGRALEILKDVEGKEAAALRRAIEREKRFSIRADYGVSSDSDELVIHRFEAGGTYHPAPSASIGLFGSRASMRQDDRPHIWVESVSLRLRKRFDESFAANLRLEPVRTNYFDPFTFDGWLTWTPVWRLRVDISFSGVMVETPLSVLREITARGASIGADLRFSERLVMTSLFGRRRYADGNYRTLWGSSLSWRALGSPVDLTIVPGYTGFSFSRWEDNGYYSPEEYHNLGCLARLKTTPVRALSILIEGRMSAEKEGEGDFFGVGMFRAEATVRATERFTLGGEFFTSNSRLAGEAGYDRTLGRIFMVIGF